MEYAGVYNLFIIYLMFLSTLYENKYIGKIIYWWYKFINFDHNNYHIRHKCQYKVHCTQRPYFQKSLTEVSFSMTKS